MKDYLIYAYKGRCKAGDAENVIKTPIKKTLEDLSYYGRDIKSFFENKTMVFYSERFNMKEIRNMVEAGRVIIPISSTVDKEEVLNYINIGLHPLFMRAKEYNQFKKDYALEA